MIKLNNMNELTYKSNLKKTLTIIVITIGLVMMYVEGIVFNKQYMEYIDLFILVPVLCISFYIQLKYKYERIFDFFLVTYAATYFIYSIHATGGYTSTEILWYFPYVFGMFVLYGFFFSFCYYLYFNIMNFTLFSFNFFSYTEKNLDFAIIFFIVSSSFTIIGYFYYQHHTQFIQLQQKVDNLSALNKLRGGLLHEINNPLNIAQLYYKKIYSQIESEHKDPIKESLERIAKVMHTLHDLDDLNELEARQYIEKQEIFTLEDHKNK